MWNPKKKKRNSLIDIENSLVVARVGVGVKEMYKSDENTQASS